MSIGQRFKSVRIKRKLSQAAFGAELKIDQPTVAKIERDKLGISNEIMQLLHNKFSVDLNWLICGTHVNNKSNSSYDTSFGETNWISEKMELLEENRQLHKRIIELESKMQITGSKPKI